MARKVRARLDVHARIQRGPGVELDADEGTTPDPATGLAPDYSAFVTRRSLGIAGQENQAHIASFPAASIARMDIKPASVVGTNSPTDPSTWNWSGIDSKVKIYLDLGIEMLGGVFYNSNVYSGWANQMAVPTKNGGLHSDANGHTFDQWKNWYAGVYFNALINRYSPYGSANPTTGPLANKIQWTPVPIPPGGSSSSANGKGCIRFWEIWNEPDNKQFWQPNNVQNYILNGQTGASYDYAELLAACYDEAKSFNKNVWVGTGGSVSGRPDPADTNGVKATVFYANLIDRWGTMQDGGTAGYKKKTNGWSDVPADFICIHPYAGSGRPGTSQQSRAANSPTADAAYNSCYYEAPIIHNLFEEQGWGSLLLWGTESENNWSPDAEENFGFRNNSTVYQQHDWQFWKTSKLPIDAFPAYDRSILSPVEAYRCTRTNFRYWRGDDPWPAKGTAPGAQRWNVLGTDTPTLTGATSKLPLGPKFYFAGGEDFGSPMPYPKPYQYGDHFGLWRQDGTKKTNGGEANSPHDYLTALTKTP